MEYINIGVIIATAFIFWWVGYFFKNTQDSKTLLANSETFNDIIIELQEEIINEMQTSQRERGKMLLNQEKIDEMIKENKTLNLEIKQTLESKNTKKMIEKDKTLSDSINKE